MQFDVDSHDDYLRLREEFSRMPKIPMLLRADAAPVSTAPNRTYNWFLTSEQSGSHHTLSNGAAARERDAYRI